MYRQLLRCLPERFKGRERQSTAYRLAGKAASEQRRLLR